MPVFNASSGFQSAALAAPDKHRLVLALQGRDGVRKTSFALTAPRPIGMINFDIGLEGVMSRNLRHPKDDSIQVSDYRLIIPKGGQTAQIAGEADRVWEKLLKDFDFALRNFRTIVLDTASEVWELLRLARFGKLVAVLPHHYVSVNSEYRDLIKQVYDTDKNLILVHKMKAEWVDVPDGKGGTKGNKTGNYIFSGFADTDFLVQMRLQLDKDLNKERNRWEYSGTVLKCRQNGELLGMRVEDDMLTFPFLASQVFPETSEEDWV